MANNPEKKVYHYSPGRTERGHFFQVWWQVIRNLINYRDLMWQLTRVELIGQFKRSQLGIAWLILNPLLQVVVWLFFKQVGVFNPGDTGIPFPVYVLLGTSIWQFFFGTFEAVSKSISASGHMFIQAKFPHEVVVAQKVMVAFVNFSIPMVLNIIVLLVYGVPLTWASLLFPLVLLPLMLLSLSLGLIFAVIEVVALDIYQATSKIIQLAMYATPVVYAASAAKGPFKLIIEYNPLTYLLGSARDMLSSGTLYDANTYFMWSGIVVVLFVLVVPFFIAAEQKVIERIAT